MLTNKNIVIGMCGGISAYKVVDVVSRLKKLGASVTVIMTENATKFISPMTLRAISHEPVVTDMFADPENWDTEHISLAEKADIFVVAPATANVIGKIASGVADDMLTTTIMATEASVLLVPAMNSGMYGNPIVQENINKLKQLGYIVMEPGSGLLACGTIGKGRLPEPPEIVEEIIGILTPRQDLLGKRVLITAGPTVEAIDPVRFISNRSSGKMGYAIAESALDRGAQVLLVSGPVNIPVPVGVELISVTTANEMYEAVMSSYQSFDIMIMMAAVADYRSETIEENKIKKTGEQMTVHLVKNHDIAAELGRVKGHRVLVGACAETENLLENAAKKIQAKNFDLIMANDVTEEGAGFGTDTNIVQIVAKDGTTTKLPLMSKREVADHLISAIIELLGKESSGRNHD
jgi:phosphopantothenoylcysteine decarboxylase / phosphopantothenate---cysteine ligase